MATQNPPRAAKQNPPKPPKESDKAMLIYKKEDYRDDFYNIGIELAASQLRIAALGESIEPSITRGSNVLDRAGFYAVGLHEWTFEPSSNSDGSKYSVPADKANIVCEKLAKFLDDAGIAVASIRQIRVGVIIAYNSTGKAMDVNAELLKTKLETAYEDVLIEGANRTRTALDVEYKYGAGIELLPNHNTIYVTISRNMNFGAISDGRPHHSALDGVFAQGARHHAVDPIKFVQYAADFLGDDAIVPPPERKCSLCEKVYCLHSIASGQGMVELAAMRLAADKSGIAESPIGIAMGARGSHARPFLHDRGATISIANTPIDSAAIFKAATFDSAYENIVLQAGIAIGMAIFDKIINADVLEPNLIVLGGTVPLGKLSDDEKSADTRATIDGMVQRVLELELQAGGKSIRPRVSRSRFAGFTGLLGVTMPLPTNE